MDPTTAYETMSNTALDLEERADCAAALVGWLAHNGRLPQKYIDRNHDNNHDVTRVHIHNVRAQCAVVLTEAWNQR